MIAFQKQRTHEAICGCEGTDGLDVVVVEGLRFPAWPLSYLLKRALKPMQFGDRTRPVFAGALDNIFFLHGA
jgi:hypothetical protein